MLNTADQVHHSAPITGGEDESKHRSSFCGCERWPRQCQAVSSTGASPKRATSAFTPRGKRRTVDVSARVKLPKIVQPWRGPTGHAGSHRGSGRWTAFGWNLPQVREFKDKNAFVRSIAAGKGATLRFTNRNTQATFWVKTNGSVTHTTTYKPDGSSTVKVTGHTVLTFFPTDGGPRALRRALRERHRRDRAGRSSRSSARG